MRFQSVSIVIMGWPDFAVTLPSWVAHVHPLRATRNGLPYVREALRDVMRGLDIWRGVRR